MDTDKQVKDYFDFREKRDHNIIPIEEYREKAQQTLYIIRAALSNSLGYYGSTTILEDKVLGNQVTKDGYTILSKLKFDTQDTIANTLLDTIQKISRSLVTEVGDGSTSAVVTSEALFRSLTDSTSAFHNKYMNTHPPKVINDTLEKIESKVKEEIKTQATPITEDNFDRLRDIATISNNNDENSGTLIYDIYKEIGKNGFISLETEFGDKDYYELSKGIEISRGLIDKAFATSANGFESSYNEPRIIMVYGELNKDDITWFSEFWAMFSQSYPSTPLIILATNYTTEFLNFIKINYDKNKYQTGMQVGVTVMNASKKEEFYDLSTYLGAQVIDKEEDALLDQIRETFTTRDQQGVNLFINRDLGSADKIYMNLNYSQFIGGHGDPTSIAERVELIDREITYYETETATHKDVVADVWRLEKRKANLQANIAKLYVTGKSDTEMSTRKDLYEDAVAASKSALEYGYVSGGNLAVPRAIDILYPEGSGLEYDLAQLVKDSFLEVYRTVLTNAYISSDKIEEILDTCLEEDQFYNIKDKTFSSISTTEVINSAMTDVRIMESVFSIIGLLVTSNQYVTANP